MARLVGHREPGADEETSFVAGLLHDVGKLVLDQYAPEEFSEILRLARSEQSSFRDTEAIVLQETSHAEIGGWLGEQWRMPPDLIDGIRCHHAVAGAEGLGARLAAICSFGDFICLAKGVGASGNFATPSLDPEAWGRLNMSKEELPIFVESVGDELTRSEMLLGAAVGFS